MTGIRTLTAEQCADAGGGLGPVLAAAYALVTSKTFIAFSGAITLVGFAADIGTEIIE